MERISFSPFLINSTSQGWMRLVIIAQNIYDWMDSMKLICVCLFIFVLFFLCVCACVFFPLSNYSLSFLYEAKVVCNFRSVAQVQARDTSVSYIFHYSFSEYLYPLPFPNLLIICSITPFLALHHPELPLEPPAQLGRQKASHKPALVHAHYDHKSPSVCQPSAFPSITLK